MSVLLDPRTTTHAIAARSLARPIAKADRAEQGRLLATIGFLI
jgi:hypothetical protein